MNHSVTDGISLPASVHNVNIQINSTRIREKENLRKSYIISKGLLLLIDGDAANCKLAENLKYEI